MEFRREKMNKEAALIILDWKYPQPYDIYNFSYSDSALNELLGGEFYCIYSGNLLAGYYCNGKSAQVTTDVSVAFYADDRFIDIGLGMNPELTGQGKGREFFSYLLKATLESNPGKNARLTVADFNLRAATVYLHHGFKYTNEFINPVTNRKFHIMIREQEKTP